MGVSVEIGEFKKQVRICLDQNMSSEALLSAGEDDIDTLSLEEIIDSKVEDAALSVVKSAPFDKLHDIVMAEEPADGDMGISKDTRHVVSVKLPEGFARLVRFKMASWPYAVFSATAPTASLYNKAHSEFNVYGTKERPVVFLVPTNKGLFLEAFCASSEEDKLEDCLYVKTPKVEGGSIVLGEQLVRPTIYYAAYLTALAIKDDSAAEKLLAIATSLIEN